MGPVTHQTIRLSKGKHTSKEHGACVMELASMLAGEPFSDHPASVCPVVGSLLRAYNDSIDDTRRQDLYRYAAKVVGSRVPAELEQRRIEHVSRVDVQARLAPVPLAAARAPARGEPADAARRARGERGPLAAHPRRAHPRADARARRQPARDGGPCADGAGCRRRPDRGPRRDSARAVARRLNDAAPELPRIPASAGALIYNPAGLLLILKPTYKKGWTIPGGQIDSGGESPWDACRRETQEECGLVVERGRLVCVDFLSPRPGRPGGARFLFDCGAFADEAFREVRLQESEIEDHRLAELGEALELLSGPLRRRLSQCAGAEHCVYLENGRPVDGVT